MKPFNLEAALRGNPIQTREGIPARFLMHVPEAAAEYRVVALVGGEVNAYSEEGRYYIDDCDSKWDLLMAPLCQVEGKDVYPGDVLYHESGGEWREFVVVTSFKEYGLTNANGHWIRTEDLTWTKRKTKRVGWINAYPDAADDCIHETNNGADQNCGMNRIACVRVEYEV